MDPWYYILILFGIIEVLLFIIIWICYRVSCLKRQMADLQIQMLLNQREESLRRQMLLQQLQRDGKTDALDEVTLLFSQKTKDLQRLYPALTETDLQVLTLIGLDVSNSDILQLTGMSKRTYYKRRQLIAQRMGTTAAALNEIARNCFTPKIN